MILRAFVLLLAMALQGGPVALAQPPKLDIPAEVRPTGQYVTFLPDTDAKAVTYVGLSGLDPIPAAVLKDGRMFLLDTRGLARGRYNFAAVAAGATGEQARDDFTVVIGEVPPVPPGPTPPDPVPPGPAPPDALVQMLQAAYMADSSPAKAQHKAALASLYRQAAAVDAHDLTLATYGALLFRLQDARKRLMADGDFVPVRKAVAQYMNGQLPTEPAAVLDSAARTKAADVFRTLSLALDAVR